MQMGDHAASNIRRALRKKTSEPFRYRDKGSLATIGRASAVADFGRLRFGGFFAWLLWLLVHVFFLIGFRNRFLVIGEWAWSYLTYERGARLITGPDPPPPIARRGGPDGSHQPFPFVVSLTRPMYMSAVM